MGGSVLHVTYVRAAAIAATLALWPALTGSRVATGIVVEGTVTSEAGTPVVGAAVSAQGTSRGATTTDGGRYAFTLPPSAKRGGEVTLLARSIGYEIVTRRVRISADTVRADFVMKLNTLRLGEVVVTGAEARMSKAAIGSAAPGRANGIAADASAAPRSRRADGNTENYARIDENPWIAPRTTPLSTFSIDVDRASYGNVRRFLDQGQLPPKDAVRIEELVNYFSYDYPAPRGDEPFSVTADVAPAPWDREHRLVRIGLQGRRVEAAALPPSNLVFLIDVSGSMQSPDKLPLVKTAFRMLVDQLRPADRVAIVVYAGSAGLVLPSTPGNEKTRIMTAIDALEAGGSTAGGEGIRLAYDVAKRNHVERGNNRVILATDGDFNVGVSSDAELTRLVEERREQGTFLTVLGFGTGNLKDSRMEQLADRGNGTYAYVDGPLEAKKMFVHEMGGTLLTIAKDVKLQVEFDPRRVAAYRLIGYENRLLRDEDFNDDAKDAGDMGAGHSVTALYEVVPVGSRSPVRVRGVDSLRYQRPSAEAVAPTGRGELAWVKLRYKERDGKTSRLREQPVVDAGARPSDDFTFAASVAAFGMLLRDSEYRGQATFEDVLAMAEASRGPDASGYRGDFIRLVKRAQELKGGLTARR
jgi:Ca-activated chloride channel family protein